MASDRDARVLYGGSTPFEKSNSTQQQQRGQRRGNAQVAGTSRGGRKLTSTSARSCRSCTATQHKAGSQGIAGGQRSG